MRNKFRNLLRKQEIEKLRKQTDQEIEIVLWFLGLSAILTLIIAYLYGTT